MLSLPRSGSALRGVFGFVAGAAIWAGCGGSIADVAPDLVDAAVEDAAPESFDATLDQVETADAFSEDADLGPCPPPMPSWDCEGPCGLGFTFAVCIDGVWQCPHSAHDPKSMECWCLADAWQAFLYNEKGCTTHDECVVVGGTGTCGCAPALGNASGDAIAKYAEPATQAFLIRFQECKDDPAFAGNAACDSAPAKNLRCEQGQCMADEASCLVDGGPTDASGGAADAGSG